MSYSVGRRKFEQYKRAIACARSKVAKWRKEGLPCVPIVKDEHLAVSVVIEDERGIVVHPLTDEPDDDGD